MVTTDDVEHLRRGVGRSRQNLQRKVHVRPEYLVFARAQRALLVQQPHRQAQLTHILQHAGHAEGRDRLVAQAKIAPEDHHVGGNIEGMVVAVLVGPAQTRQPQQRIGIAGHAEHHLRHHTAQALEIRIQAALHVLGDLREQTLSAPNQRQRRNDFLFDRNDRLGVDHARRPAAAGTRLFAGDAVAAGALGMHGAGNQRAG